MTLPVQMKRVRRRHFCDPSFGPIIIESGLDWAFCSFRQFLLWCDECGPGSGDKV